MGTIVKRPPGKKAGYMSVGATKTHRVKVLRKALDLYAHAGKPGFMRRGSAPLEDIITVWESGLFSFASLEEITGITRKSLRGWMLGNDRVQIRVKGKIQVHHIEPIIQRLIYGMREADPTLDEFIQQLAKEGSAEYLVRPVLEDISDSQSVRGEVRSDDEGHPEESEGGSADQHTGPSVDGPGEGAEEPEPADLGPIQGPTPRNSTPKPSSTQGARFGLEYVGVDAEGREVVRDATGTEITGEDWDPFADFEPDEAGDSFLASTDEPQGGGGLPDLPPVGAPWEMLEEGDEEASESGH